MARLERYRRSYSWNSRVYRSAVIKNFDRFVCYHEDYKYCLELIAGDILLGPIRSVRPGSSELPFQSS